MATASLDAVQRDRPAGREAAPVAKPDALTSAPAGTAARPSGLQARRLTPAALLGLQRMAGNGTVSRMLQRCGSGGCTCGGKCGGGARAPLKMSRPDDLAEQEADLIGRRIARAAAARAVQRTASEGSLPVPGHVEEGIERLQGKGTPLERETRNTMERAFGRDLGHVRVHRGPEAASLARAVDAEAFTVGSDIFMGDGRAAPGHAESGYILAHELTHVVQSGGDLQRRTLFRVSPSMCCKATDCVVPDVAGGPSAATKWTLTIAVDREEEGLGRLASGNVGHTWVKLQADNGEKWSFGMWPQSGFDPKHPFTSVAGCIHHPDTAHEPPAATDYLAIDYDLTKKQYDDALAFAQGECARAPDYNLMSYNCTSFAIQTARKAGVSPPSSTTLAVHNPNALYEGIEEELEKRRKAATPKKGSGSGGGKKTAQLDTEQPMYA